MVEDNQVIIPEETVKEEVVTLEDQLNELTEEERQMAEDQGLLKKEENKSEKKEEAKKDEGKKEEEQPKPIQEEDYDTFDKVHDLYENNKDVFYSLPRSVKNQYHNAKGLFKRVKEEEAKRKQLEDDGGYNKLQETVAKSKIERLAKRIQEAKIDPEGAGLTVEELEQLIDMQQKSDDSDRPLTVKDLESLKQKEAEELKKTQDQQQAQQERVAEKIRETEIYAKEKISSLTDGKHEKFEEVVSLAHEVAKTKPRFARHIVDVLNGEDSIEDVVDTVISIAKINPNYGKTMTDVDRIEKNAAKTKTSANITGGKGGRVVSHDDLTPEDAARLPKEQWEKLPREVRRRLLMQI